MKKTLYQLLFALLFISIAGCQKGTNPYVPKSVIDKLDSVRHPAIKNIAFIYNNDVYFLADFSAKPVQITKTGGIKKFIKMSHDHTRFAYQNAAGQITVVDNTGKVIATLSQYSDVRNFDWSFDDKTLYIINGDQVAFYGPAIKVPSVIYYQGFYNFISAAISKNGDLAYLLRKSIFDGNDQYAMVTRLAAGGNPVFYRPDDDDLPMKSVNFSANGVDIVLGFADQYSADDVSDKVYLFDNLGAYPSHTFTFGSISTPAYQRSTKYLIGGLDDADSHQHLIKTLYLDTDVPDNNKLFSGYAGIKYLDWK